MDRNARCRLAAVTMDAQKVSFVAIHAVHFLPFVVAGASEQSCKLLSSMYQPMRPMRDLSFELGCTTG